MSGPKGSPFKSPFDNPPRVRLGDDGFHHSDLSETVESLKGREENQGRNEHMVMAAEGVMTVSEKMQSWGCQKIKFVMKMQSDAS